MCLGVPGQIESISDAENALAWVRLAGVRRQVNIACVCSDDTLDELVGTWVIVHAGFALERLDADEALRTLDLLQQLALSHEDIH